MCGSFFLIPQRSVTGWATVRCWTRAIDDLEMTARPAEDRRTHGVVERHVHAIHEPASVGQWRLLGRPRRHFLGSERTLSIQGHADDKEHHAEQSHGEPHGPQTTHRQEAPKDDAHQPGDEEILLRHSLSQSVTPWRPQGLPPREPSNLQEWRTNRCARPPRAAPDRHGVEHNVRPRRRDRRTRTKRRSRRGWG